MPFPIHARFWWPADVRRAADDFDAQLGGFLSTEHKDDGRHADITVDSIAERGRSFGIGMTQTIAFNAGIFSADSGGTWVVDAADFEGSSYRIIGDTMTLGVSVSGTTTTGSPANLIMAIPSGWKSAETCGFPIFAANGGTALSLFVGYVYGTDSLGTPRTNVYFNSLASFWPNAANALHLRFQASFKVVTT